MIKIPDIIQLNDWEPRKFLRIIIVIQTVMLASICLDLIGFEIPIVRQVIGYIYLTFVPGIIILRILRQHKLGVSETVLFSTGLSISFLMFSGFFLNTILSFLNISSPLSFWHVIIFITVLLTVLLILSYKIDRFYQYELPHLTISRTALYLMLLPVLSIVGTHFVNFHNNNIYLLLLIVSIALIPVLIALKRIPSELYPLAVVVISISLLLHRSLISMYLTGWDIHTEYYFHKLVIDNAYWNSEMYSNVNAMLSIVILPAIYSYFLKMDGAWIFKIVYPIIYSLVPLGLYYIYKHQVKSDEIAFYSVFFFMSFFVFFTEMLSLARQEIAELFFVLLLFLMVHDTFKKNICNFLLLVFGASLATSHYGLSYIYIILLIVMYIFSINIIRNLKIKGLVLPEFNLNKMTLNYFVIFFIIFSLFWYMSVSGSSTFKSIVNIGEHVFISIFTEFFNMESRDRDLQMALGLADPIVSSFGRQMHRYLQFITQFLIIIGFVKLIMYKEFGRLKAEYSYLIVGSLAILFLSLLPYSAESLNMTRIYHITLLALSPLLIVGCIFIIEKLITIIDFNNTVKHNHIVLISILGILIPYFLFNTGFIYEMTKDVPSSMSLGMERMKQNNVTKADFYNTYTPEQDVHSAGWLYKNRDENRIIYADDDSKLHVLISYGRIPSYEIYSLFINVTLLTEDSLDRNSYLFLNQWNVCDNTFVIVDTSEIISLIGNSSKVYSNGCGEIYEQ